MDNYPYSISQTSSGRNRYAAYASQQQPSLQQGAPWYSQLTQQQTGSTSQQYSFVQPQKTTSSQLSSSWVQPQSSSWVQPQSSLEQHQFVVSEEEECFFGDDDFECPIVDLSQHKERTPLEQACAVDTNAQSIIAELKAQLAEATSALKTEREISSDLKSKLATRDAQQSSSASCVVEEDCFDEDDVVAVTEAEELTRGNAAELEARDLIILGLRETSIKLSRQVCALTTQLDEMQKATANIFADFSRSLKGTSQEIRQILANTADVQQEFESKVEQTSGLENKLVIAQAQLRETQANHEERLAELNAEIERVKGELRALQGEQRNVRGQADEQITALRKELETLTKELEEAKNAMHFALARNHKLADRVIVLSKSTARLQMLVSLSAKGPITQSMRAQADAFTAQCFHETVNLVAKGPYLPPNVSLNAGTTWGDLARSRRYAPTCIISDTDVNFDTAVFNRRDQLATIESNSTICPVPTGKFVGKAALDSGLYLLHAGENKVNVQFPLQVRRVGDGQQVEVKVLVVLGSFFGDVQMVSFLENGQLLNGRTDGARLSTSHDVVQAQFESVQQELPVANSKNRASNLVDHENNTDDAFMTLGAQFGLVSDEQIGSLQTRLSGSCLVLMDLRMLIDSVRLGKTKLNPKQALAFQTLSANAQTVIGECLRSTPVKNLEAEAPTEFADQSSVVQDSKAQTASIDVGGDDDDFGTDDEEEASVKSESSAKAAPAANASLSVLERMREERLKQLQAQLDLQKQASNPESDA